MPDLSDVLVLCYHAVSERWGANLSIAPDQLFAQLRDLVSRGYRGTTFTEAIHNRPHRRTLAVTFDDAYRSVLELALPVLERLELPGSVFVPTSYAGRDEPMSWPGISEWASGPDAAELRPMSWDELKRLADGDWEIGSHTRTHPRLTALDDSALREELAGSREDCERALGRPCTSVAYPYGDVDDRVIAAARRAGYVAGAELAPRRYRVLPLEWPRLCVMQTYSLARFRRHASPAVRQLQRSPLGGLTEAAYAAVNRRVRSS